MDVLRKRQVEHAGADHGSPADAEHVGIDAEHRHHHAERDDARQHEEIDRRDAERRERVDLLRHLHRADLGGETGSRAPCHDDARHDAAHLAHHRDPDEVGDVDLRAEALELHRADESEDHSDEHADQGHDRERPCPALLDEYRQVAEPKAGRSPHESSGRERDVADERHGADAVRGEIERGRAEARHPRHAGRYAPHARLLAHGPGERKQPLHAGRERVAVHRDVVAGAQRLDVPEKRDESAVPRAELVDLEHDRAGPPGGELMLDPLRGRKPAPEGPRPREPDRQRAVAGIAADREGRLLRQLHVSFEQRACSMTHFASAVP